MRFKLGVAAGMAIGWWAATRSSEQRRAEIEDGVRRVREHPRVRHLSEVVARDARRIGDAVEEKLASGADVATEKIAGPDQGGGTGTGTGTGTASRTG